LLLKSHWAVANDSLFDGKTFATLTGYQFHVRF
jgi:hypothetical protein